VKGKLLVTGATGFLGTHLVDRLLSPGSAEPSRLRILARTAVPGMKERGVDVAPGSILDESACAAALENVSAVFHLAGQVSRNPEDAALLYKVHVQGTAVLCRAAKKAGVDRIVLASTSGTIAVTETGETIPDESFAPPLKLMGGWPYYTSKLYQEETARRECQGGPDLVILNPSLLLGPGDKRLSSTEDVLKLLACDIPVVPPGGVNFVDVRDAAAAFESALSRGRSGERYLLGGPNWTFETFFAKLSRIGGVKGPRIKLPDRIYSFAGKAVEAFYKQWDRTPPVDRVSVEMGQRFWWLDASKAERELGFQARDPYETLYETIAYIKKEFLSQAVLS
jgi:dihydroflavonol-4-reductase